MLDNRKGLQTGYLLPFDKQEYIIENELGRGATGIVYEGHYQDADKNNHIVRIKELYPWACNISRKENGILSVPEDKIEEFEEAALNFTNAYNKSIKLRNTPGMMNYIVDFVGKYTANNTLYYVMGCDEGMDYSNDCDSSLKSVFERIQTLCRLVGEYHKQGMLLLDIKPENIFIMPETTELIKMFDFDSIISKDELKAGKKLRISYSNGYAAHEVKIGNRQEISEASDVFAIGSIAFLKLFDRTPDAKDCSLFSHYDFKNMKFGDIQYDPKLYKILSKFLHKSISASKQARASSVEELQVLLESMIELSDLDRNYINSYTARINKNFIGRTEELESIHDVLSEDRIMFLSGVGGVGKTEIARYYVAKYGKEYDSIIFAPYVVDIKSMINDDNIVSIHNFYPDESENENDYFWMKIRKLREICDENVLFVIDNLNYLEDENLNRLLDIGCSFLITTRRDCSMLPYKSIMIGAIDSHSAKTLFSMYYTQNIDSRNQEIIDKILHYVGYHTYTVELLAKQLLASHISPEGMLERLCEGTTSKISERISQGKDGQFIIGTVSEHIERLFDFEMIQDAEVLDILRNAALIISGAGIDIEDFKEICDLDGYDKINKLIDEGWFMDQKNDRIHVHPIVSEILVKKFSPNAKHCNKLIVNLLSRIENCLENDLMDRQECSKVLQFVSFAAIRLLNIQDKSELTFNFLNRAAIFLKRMYVYKDSERIAEWVCKYIPYIEHDEKFEIEAYENFADIKLHKKEYIIAESFYLKALSLALQVYGKVNPYAAKLYNDMGKIYIACGDYDMAVLSLLRAFSIRLELVKERGISKGLLQDMGLLYFDLTNDNSMLDYYRIEIVGQFKLLNGSTANDVLMNICNMPHVADEQVKSQVLQYYSDATKKRIASYSRYTLDSATAIHNIGVLHDIFGETDEAIDKYMEALEIKTALMGEDYISCAVTCENIGNDFQKKHEVGEALEYYQKAVDIYKDFYGEYSVEVQKVKSKINNMNASFL